MNEEKNECKPVKLDPDKILKSLPKGFVQVRMPKGTRTVDVMVDLNIIPFDAAKKALKLAAKPLGLVIVDERHNDEAKEAFLRLEDSKFNKEMRESAKAALKAVNAFYSKYGTAYRYDDIACESVRKIMSKVNNDE